MNIKKTPLAFTPATQPYGISKTSMFHLKNAVALSIGEESHASLRNMGYSEAEASNLVHYGFWKFVASSSVERHAEGHQLLNPLADTFMVFATGAMPIQIAMDGFLYTTKDQDHRLDFIDMYNTKLRGTNLKKQKFVIVLSKMDTIMRLRIQGINMTYRSRLSDWTAMGFHGVGFSYAVRGLSTPDPDTVAADGTFNTNIATA